MVLTIMLLYNKCRIEINKFTICLIPKDTERIFFLYLYNTALRSYIYTYYMVAIADQTAGLNWLIFLREHRW